MLSWRAALGGIVAFSTQVEVAALSASVNDPTHHQEAGYKSLGITHQGKVQHVHHHHASAGLHGHRLMRTESAHERQDVTVAGRHQHGSEEDVQAVIDQGGQLSKEGTEDPEQAVSAERDLESEGTRGDEGVAARRVTHQKAHSHGKEHHNGKDRRHAGGRVGADHGKAHVDDLQEAQTKGFSAMIPDAIQHSAHAREVAQESADATHRSSSEEDAEENSTRRDDTLTHHIPVDGEHGHHHAGHGHHHAEHGHHHAAHGHHHTEHGHHHAEHGHHHAEHAELPEHGHVELAENSHGAELAETDSEFLPALGLSNPSDLAYRAMDMMMGIASVIPEDYPFVCICLDTGACDENLPEDKKTVCPSRIGQKAAATRAPLSFAALLALAAMYLMM